MYPSSFAASSSLLQTVMCTKAELFITMREEFRNIAGCRHNRCAKGKRRMSIKRLYRPVRVFIARKGSSRSWVPWKKKDGRERSRWKIGVGEKEFAVAERAFFAALYDRFFPFFSFAPLFACRRNTWPSFWLTTLERRWIRAIFFRHGAAAPCDRKLAGSI